MKKILFIIFISLLFIPCVNAKSVDYAKQFWITGRSHSSVVDRRYHSIDFTGTVANSKDIGRYAIDVENNFGNYDYISFYVYNQNTMISSFPSSSTGTTQNPENSSLISPIVMLNRFPCSVTPIGASTTKEPWYFDSFFAVTCPVYPKDETSDFNLEMLALAGNSTTSSYWAFSKLFNAFDDGASYEEVIESNNEINSSVNDLKDNITSSDTSQSENQANSFFEGFQDNDYGFSDIITMPLDLIRGLTNNSCVALSLTIPFVNKTFELPCMSSIYSSHFGSFFTIYQTITFGFVAYWVVVKIFALVKSFKDPNDDKIEVVDL